MVRLILRGQRVLLLYDRAPQFDTERQDFLVHAGRVQLGKCHIPNFIHVLLQVLLVLAHKVDHQHQRLLTHISVFTFAEVDDVFHYEVTFLIHLQSFFQEILRIENSFQGNDDNFSVGVVQ